MEDDDDGLTRLAAPVSADDHVRGSVDAPVTLVEYANFACPFCARAYPVVKALEETYGDRLRVVFRSYPLAAHGGAQAAAEAAEFAADHGAFWAFHDALFAREGALDEASLVGTARALGLDGDALAVALRERTYAGIVADVKEGGDASAIPATPSFFLNGVLFEDEPTFAALSEAIDWVLLHPEDVDGR